MLLRALLPVVRVPAQKPAVMLATAPRVWGGTPSVCNPMVMVTHRHSCSGPASLWRPHVATQRHFQNCSNPGPNRATSAAAFTLPLTTLATDPQQVLTTLFSTSPAVEEPPQSDQAAPPGAAAGLVPTGSRLLLLGVDPDGQGAIAALTCDIYTTRPAPATSSTTSSVTSADTHSTDGSQLPASILSSAAPTLPPCGCEAGAAAVEGAGPGALPCHLDLGSAQVVLYDMPRLEVPLATKAKGGKVRTRKRLDIDAVVALVQHLVEQHMPQPPTPAAVTAAAGSTGAAQATPDTLTPVPDSSSSEKGGGRGGLVLRAVLEVTGGILPINGMYSIQTSAYIQGAWLGVLRASGFEVCSVTAKVWKRDLGLLCGTKDASRALAASVFEGQAGLLKHKKDHGRAEALLLAAWGGGLTAGTSPSGQRTSNNSTTSSSSSSFTAGPCRVHLLCDASGQVLAPVSSLAAAAERLQQVGGGGRRRKASSGDKAPRKRASKKKGASAATSLGDMDGGSHTTSSDGSSSDAVDSSTPVKRRRRAKEVAAAELEPVNSSEHSDSAGVGGKVVKPRGRPKKVTPPPL